MKWTTWKVQLVAIVLTSVFGYSAALAVPAWVSEKQLNAGNYPDWAGERAQVKAFDWDGNGTLDLIGGNGNGEMFVAKNRGYTGPLLEEAKCVINTRDNRRVSFPAPIRVDVTDVTIAEHQVVLVGDGEGVVTACYFPLERKGMEAYCDRNSPNRVKVIPGSTAPVYHDYSGDGVPDLYVGASDGRVYRFLNLGTGTDPELVADGFYGDGTEFGTWDFGENAVPTVVDFNEDGIEDLAVGNGDGQVMLCREPAADCFELVMQDRKRPHPLRGNRDAAPEIVDFDHDGTLDILVGDGAGTVQWSHGFRVTDEVEGDGAVTVEDALEVFAEPQKRQFENIDRLPGGYSQFVMVDGDGDGTQEVLAGSNSGFLYLFLNRSSNNLDLWHAETFLRGNTSYTLQFPPPVRVTVSKSRNTPFPVAFVGDGDGKVHRCVLYSSQRPLRLYCQPVIAGGEELQVPGGNAAPSLADSNGDGHEELLVGAGDGRVHYYDYLPVYPYNQFSVGVAIQFPDGTMLDVGENAVPVAADLNDDGFTDAIIGNAEGKVIQCDRATWTCMPLNNFDQYNYGPVRTAGDAAPSLADIDQDGSPDLILGNREGHMKTFKAKKIRTFSPSYVW